MTRNRLFGESGMDTNRTQQAALITKLSFGRGAVGRRYPLTTAEAVTTFGSELAQYTRPLTVHNTADCGDGRPIVRLANGVADPALLRERVAPRWFGGLGLATTKALVAADHWLVRDARTMQQAYEITSTFLSRELRQRDAGHAGCGASNAVVDTGKADKAIVPELLVPSVRLFVPDADEATVMAITTTKAHRLEDGFYAGWNPTWHTDYLTQRFPENFAYLADDPDDPEVHGHNESGLYVVTHEGDGFAGNAFTENTGGSQAFVLTPSKIAEIAHSLGGSDAERLVLMAAFADDALHIGAGLVTADLPVFAQAA